MNFQIETVSFCDLTCTECPNWMMKRKRQFMSRDVWDVIVNNYVIPYKSLNAHLSPPTIIPHKDGEPLLNKRLPELLATIADADPSFKIDIYTHGLLLKRSFIEFLGSLPNRIRLLISFHFNNHDGTVNDYTQTDSLLREIFASCWQPQNIEFILASHVIKPMTRDRLEEWKSTWAGPINAGRVTVHANCSINPWTGLIDDPGTVEFNGCPYAEFGHMFFGASGNIVACCLDLEEEIVFGNVMVDEPAAMVAKLEEFYAAQRRKELRHEVCRNCFGMGKRLDQSAGNLVQLGVSA